MKKTAKKSTTYLSVVKEKLILFKKLFMQTLLRIVIVALLLAVTKGKEEIQIDKNSLQENNQIKILNSCEYPSSTKSCEAFSD